MKNERKTLWLRATFCGFILAVTASFFPFAAASAGLSDAVVRLHVVANSDREEDQRVKLLVRDAVLKEAAGWYGEAETLEEANAALCVHLGAIESAANEALQKSGSSDKAKVQMTDQYFPTRDYEDFSFPAGKYRTLKIVIGKGEGHNWWCVVFPALCIPAAEEDAFSTLPQAQRELVKKPEGYRVKFKAVEWYEALRSALDFS